MSASHNLRTSSLFLLVLFGVMTANASIQKIFKKDRQGFLSYPFFKWIYCVLGLAIIDGLSKTDIGFNYFLAVPLLRFADIISIHYVDSEIDCSFRCLKEPTCVGFKYKHGVNSPSVNCQLSNSTGENDMADDDDQGWMFFVDITSKLVRKRV